MIDALQYLLDYFQVSRPWDINTVHGANEGKRHNQYFIDPNVHMFECDTEYIGSKVENINLKHDGVGDLNLILAMKQLIHHNKGLKWDRKLTKEDTYRRDDNDIILNALNTHWDPKIPVWINGDVLNGPNWTYSNHKCLDPEDFVGLFNTYHNENPNAMLSLGYLTGYRANNTVEPYTNQMVDEMKQVVQASNGLVTIALRYANLMVNQGALEGFLNLGSVTIWNREDRISRKQFDQLEKSVESLNVFKDLTGIDGNPIWK